MKALASVRTLSAAFLLLGFATPAFAQPVPGGCATTIDDLGELVRDLDSTLGAEGSGEYGSLGGTLDGATVHANIAGLSKTKRRELAGKLLTIAQDRSLTGNCDKNTVRYNAAMVLNEMAAAAANDGSSPADRAYFLDCLIKAAQAETDPAAKRQMVLNLDRLTKGMTTAQKAHAAELVEEYLPSSPHYPTIFGADGKKTVVNVVVHAGDETLEHGKFDQVFEAAGATVTKRNRDGSLEIEYVVTPDDPTGRYQPVTYKIKVIDEFKDDFSNLDVFDKMDKDDPAVELYNYHSQYGSGLSKSIREGADNPESKKIFMLGSCKSKVNAGRIEARYPKIGSIYTRDSEYMHDTPRSLQKMLSELVNRPTWSQINRSMSYAGLFNDDNYFFPNDRRRLAYLDSDLDGIPDLHDTGVNCGLKQPPQSNDYKPKTPVAGKIAGEKVLYAVTAANGVMGYTAFTEGLEDKFVSDGLAPADPGGPRVIFTPAKEDGPFGKRDVVKVRLNAAYSHMSDTALAGMMLREFVMYEKSRDGRTPTLDDTILAYAMGVKLFDAWDGQGGEAAYAGFQKTYNLGKNFSLFEAASKIDHDNGVTSKTIDYFRAKLSGGNG